MSWFEIFTGTWIFVITLNAWITHKRLKDAEEIIEIIHKFIITEKGK